MALHTPISTALHFWYKNVKRHYGAVLENSVYLNLRHYGRQYLDSISVCTYNHVQMEIKTSLLAKEVSKPAKKPSKIDILDTLKNSAFPYFTRSNLMLLLGENRRTLDAKISRLIKDGLLLRVAPGEYINKTFYDKLPPLERVTFLEYISTVLVYPSYISLEYALSQYNFLAESLEAVTLVTTKKTQKFTLVRPSFIYRSVKPQYFNSYSQRTFKDYTYPFASLSKAFFDLVYLTPLRNATETKAFLFDSRFNWDIFNPSQREELEFLLMSSNSPKLQKTGNYLKKEGIL